MTSNATIHACPRCRSASANAIDDLCPACLMSQALAAQDETLAWESELPTPDSGPETWPQLLGDYRLLRLLGSGGMGRVYEAEHLETGRRVALKRLGSRLDSPAMRQRFLREGRLAASVSHPNSLYVFGSEDVAGIPVITMEVAEGGTLQDELKKRGPLPVKEAIDAILDVISGLEAAQAVGVLHRDVKPSNCFVTPEGTVKVGDYGLSISSHSRDDSCATEAGTIMGTPAFASPEQLRGDDLDLRADIYSVGATLFTLLTQRAPFEGQNAVQVVANAVNMVPPKLTDLRPDLPSGIERIVARCLAKEPDGRFNDYAALRHALLPFSSRDSEPASMKVRGTAGWIDFLLAFFVPYVGLMLLYGSSTFHFGWLVDRTLPAALPYLLFVAFGLLYFTLTEGLWGAGFGKRRKGLHVVRTNGQRPGPLRALIRIASPIAATEAVRLPLLFATITPSRIEASLVQQIFLYTVITALCPWIPNLLNLIATRANGFATPWDLLSGTRVVFRPTGLKRPLIEPVGQDLVGVAAAEKTMPPAEFGPFLIQGQIGGDSWHPAKDSWHTAKDTWYAATDTVLRRPVWLLKRQGPSDCRFSDCGPSDGGPSERRRGVSRPGRPRWLQKVQSAGDTWDAYEASPGAPFRSQLVGGRRIPWNDLRHWLHDLASEMWAAAPENTLPPVLGLDHIWLTSEGRAVLLDSPWPASPTASSAEATGTNEAIPVDDLAGQQRFLHLVAQCAETTSLPLHARPALQNLGGGKFDKLSFVAGTLRGLLDRPATLSRGVRAGALFMLPTYSFAMMLVGSQESLADLEPSVADFGSFTFFAALVIIACCAVAQLLVIPLRTTHGHALFRLAVIDANGQLASRWRLLARWAIAWLPFLAVMTWTAIQQQSLATIWPRAWLAAWLGAALHAALNPHQGLHDRLSGTWVVRR